MDTPRDNSEHYNNELYQRTVEIERMCSMGVEADEVYRREADFALQTVNMDLGENDRILDLASGAGNHIARLDERLKGKVKIDGVEKAEKLAAIANGIVLAKKRAGVREHLKVHIGDMADIQGALPEKDVQYKLITSLGSSFIYLNKAKREKTLKDMFNILAPGGKVIFQWREPQADLREKKRPEIEARRGDRYGIENIQKKGQTVGLLMDKKQGDAFYHYSVDTVHPDPDHAGDYEMYRNKQTGLIEYREKNTKVEYKSFSRVYDSDFRNPDDPSKREVDLGSTTVNEFTSTMKKDAAIAALREVGFTNVQFHDDKEPIGYHKLFAIVATKPSREVEEGNQRQINFWRDRN